MIEGTSNPFGSFWVANVVRKRETGDWRFEALVFSTNFRTGFDVEEFQTILPKNLIHRVVPGEPIYHFFEAWKQCAASTSSVKTYGARQWFIAAVERMEEQGYPIESQRKWLSKGFLIWKLNDRNKFQELSVVL
jgi:hypothetical protein